MKKVIFSHCHYCMCQCGTRITVEDNTVLAIEPGGPPHTRMTLRSSRDDNRDEDVWMAMVDVANAVADALGGWDITRP